MPMGLRALPLYRDILLHPHLCLWWSGVHSLDVRRPRQKRILKVLLC